MTIADVDLEKEFIRKPVTNEIRGQKVFAMDRLGFSGDMRSILCKFLLWEKKTPFYGFQKCNYRSRLEL